MGDYRYDDEAYLMFLILILLVLGMSGCYGYDK